MTQDDQAIRPGDAGFRRRNVEIKARLADLAAVRRIAQRLASEHLGVQEQRDTYFYCPHGRLKLREIAGQAAQLIAYARPDVEASKVSDYHLVDVADADALRAALAAACGVRVVVEKRREIFLRGQVRIHLDEVAGLGTFLELEGVVGPALSQQAASREVVELRSALGIADDDLIATSYGELLADRSSCSDAG